VPFLRGAVQRYDFHSSGRAPGCPSHRVPTAIAKKALDINLHFYNIGNMEKQAVIAALSALAHESRLDVFRYLMQQGADGAPAGEIAARLALPGATLSFHLSALRHAGLVWNRRNGRSIIYTADFEAMNAVLAYLTENCCQGQSSECAIPHCDTGTARATAASTRTAVAKARRR